MPGTKLGARRGWANRLGISIDELDRQAADGRSWCYLCREWLPLDKFGTDRSRWNGKKSVCKACSNHKHTAWTYGLTVEDSRRLRSCQVACAICGRHNQKMEVDHDHSTGLVRGLLCSRCNGALGQFCDNIELLQKAISYLEKHNV